MIIGKNKKTGLIQKTITRTEAHKYKFDNFFYAAPVTVPLNCRSKQFSCVSDGVKKCLNNIMKCNGVQDCDDNSDEAGCVKSNF